MGNAFQGRKIRIISCDHPRKWYADKIGQEFIAQSECSRNRVNLVVRTTIQQAGWPYGWVNKKDCEFV